MFRIYRHSERIDITITAKAITYPDITLVKRFWHHDLFTMVTDDNGSNSG